MALLICSAFLSGCAQSESMNISIEENGSTIIFDYRESNVVSILKMVIWEKDKGDILWALSGLYAPAKIEYGKIPQPKRTKLGYVQTPARQLFPVDTTSPKPLSGIKEFYILFEVDEDTILGPNLDILLFQATLEDDNYFIHRVTPPQKFPDAVESLWMK